MCGQVTVQHASRDSVEVTYVGGSVTYAGVVGLDLYPADFPAGGSIEACCLDSTGVASGVVAAAEVRLSFRTWVTGTRDRRETVAGVQSSQAGAEMPQCVDK